MAVVFESDTPKKDSTFSSIVNDERNRAIFYQILVFSILAWLAWYLFTNTAHNLEVRGMSAGFGFLNTTAGFNRGRFGDTCQLEK